jgi:hypothetical protein
MQKSINVNKHPGTSPLHEGGAAQRKSDRGSSYYGADKSELEKIFLRNAADRGGDNGSFGRISPLQDTIDPIDRAVNAELEGKGRIEWMVARKGYQEAHTNQCILTIWGDIVAKKFFRKLPKALSNKYVREFYDMSADERLGILLPEVLQSERSREKFAFVRALMDPAVLSEFNFTLKHRYVDSGRVASKEILLDANGLFVEKDDEPCSSTSDDLVFHGKMFRRVLETHPNKMGVIQKYVKLYRKAMK